MRICIAGNVAQNSFNLARSLREFCGIEADSYDSGGPQRIWTPHWEEADFDPILAPASFNEGGRTWYWRDVDIRNGWTRPPWARILGMNGGPAWFATQEQYESYLDAYRVPFGRLCAPVLDLVCRNRDTLLPVADIHREQLAWPQERQHDFTLPLPRQPQDWVPTRKWEASVAADVWQLPRTEAIRELSRHYDMLVLWGPEASNGIVLDRDRPYIACEHGTMRHVARKNTIGRRLLALAYQWADHCVLTNADCVRDAKALGLSRYSFIPHPVDTESKFRPLAQKADAVLARRVQRLRETLLEWTGAEVLFFAPARQSQDKQGGEKGNEKLFLAYKRYLDEAEPKGAPRAVLVLAGWGTELLQGHHSIRRLGIGPRVTWFPVLPKRQLAVVYQVMDVIFDQFAEDVGSFGTITVEALSCAKPVVTYINEALNAWAFPVLPPVVNALSVDEIYQAMVRLAQSPDERERLGQQGRRWVVQHHSARLVAEAHRGLYQQVLEGREGSDG